MADGNRKDPRARVLNMTVRYKSATVDEFIENHSHDISRGGIFIKTRSPFPAGTLLKFEVRIAEDQKVMNGVGRVVWRREAERAEEGFPAGMGIKFIKIGEGAAELISQMVAARQGAESSFDAGIRQTTDQVAPENDAEPASPGIPSLEAPALQVESAPLSLVPGEAETRVSNLPKKRPEQAPERKVVLQGPALESPPSERADKSSSAQAPRQRSDRARSTLAEETTSPGARKRQEARNNPSLYALFAVLGLAGLGLVVFRGKAPEVSPPLAVPAPPIEAEPPAPAAATAEAPAVSAPIAAADEAPEGAATGEEAEAVPAGSGEAVAQDQPAPESEKAPAAPVASAAAARPAAAPPAPAPAPTKPAVVAPHPKAPVAAAAPARPSPPRATQPAAPRQPAKPAAPPPAVTEPPAAAESPAAPAPSAPAATAPAPQAPPSAAAEKPTAPAGSNTAPASPKPAPPPPAATAPSTPPAAPAPAPPAAAPSDDNPY